MADPNQPAVAVKHEAGIAVLGVQPITKANPTRTFLLTAIDPVEGDSVQSFVACDSLSQTSNDTRDLRAVPDQFTST